MVSLIINACIMLCFSFLQVMQTFSASRLDYCEFLTSIHKGTETRKAFDRALQALPITQHRELWDLYIDWATKFGVEETAIRVYRRYLMYDPGSRESFVAYLEEVLILKLLDKL